MPSSYSSSGRGPRPADVRPDAATQALLAPGGSAVVALQADEDVVRLRKQVRDLALALGFSLVDQTKIVTAASELARNVLRYGGGGECRVARASDAVHSGIALTFVDHGPGIADIALAMTDGYTTGGGMGLGLSGAKRLSDVFELDTSPTTGTTVKIVKWKPY